MVPRYGDSMGESAVLREAVATLRTRFDACGYSSMPIVDLGALVAGADGSVDQEEIAALRDMFDGMLGSAVSADTVEHLVRASLQVVEEAGPEARIRVVAEILVDCDAVEAGLLVAYAVANASDGISASEESRIAALASATGIQPATLSALRARIEGKS
jgi:tellurite resistance protein